MNYVLYLRKQDSERYRCSTTEEGRAVLPLFAGGLSPSCSKPWPSPGVSAEAQPHMLLLASPLHLDSQASCSELLSAPFSHPSAASSLYYMWLCCLPSVWTKMWASSLPSPRTSKGTLDCRFGLLHIFKCIYMPFSVSLTPP